MLGGMFVTSVRQRLFFYFNELVSCSAVVNDLSSGNVTNHCQPSNLVLFFVLLENAFSTVFLSIGRHHLRSSWNHIEICYTCNQSWAWFQINNIRSSKYYSRRLSFCVFFYPPGWFSQNQLCLANIYAYTIFIEPFRNDMYYSFKSTSVSQIKK